MFTLPDLPYTYAALEPFIDTKTMHVHHDLHHAAYVKNLNAALEAAPQLFNRDIVDLVTNLTSLPADVQTAVRNHGGGHLNHSLFWQFLTPEKTVPQEKLLSALDHTFGSLDKFKEQFSAKALSHFGSGWAWLVSKQGKLAITSTSNQDSPYTAGETPLLCLDVWEHAYYLLYQNRRVEYISAWWNVVNWNAVSGKFLDATS